MKNALFLNEQFQYPKNHFLKTKNIINKNKPLGEQIFMLGFFFPQKKPEILKIMKIFCPNPLFIFTP